MDTAVSPWGEDDSPCSCPKTTQTLFARGPGAPGVCRHLAPPLGGFTHFGWGVSMRLLQPHHPPGPCSTSGDQRDLTAPGPLQGALSKGVSWSRIKTSFYWRSASFKECRIYWSSAGCWPPAATFPSHSPLAFLFGLDRTSFPLTCLSFT